MKKLIIFPFNGNGLEALDCVGDQYEFIGFADDTKAKQGKQSRFEVFSRQLIADCPEAFVLAVPGSPASYKIRHEIIAALDLSPDRFATVIHPRAVVANRANIGYNTLIMAGVVVTSNAQIGNHVCLLPNTVVHHDSSVGDYTLIGSNVTVAGNTQVGSNCYIGSGCSIINGVCIGNGTLVGIGSNVLKSISQNSKAVGNPARILS